MGAWPSCCHNGNHLALSEQIVAADPSTTGERRQIVVHIGGSDDELPVCPLFGCTLAFLECCCREWLKSKIFNGDVTDFMMGSLCQKIIKQTTRRKTMHDTKSMCVLLSKLSEQTEPDDGFDDSVANAAADGISFAEWSMAHEMQDDQGILAFSKATHFVSHAWRYNFTTFVKAIRHWCDTNDINENITYFWVDAFVVNQHQSQNYPQEWWSTRFMQAIGSIGNTILVLEPWENPVVFQRAWVIWEVYCTTVTGARLHISMMPETKENFNESLITSFEKVQTAMSKLDVSTSEAFHKKDRDMIHGEITKTIGFTKLNEIVTARLTQWLIDTTQMRVKDMATNESCIRIGEVTPRMKLVGNLARMLRETGNVSDALLQLEKLVEETMTKLSLKDVFTLSCMNQLAVTYLKEGDSNKAMEMHRKCLRCRIEVLGEQHPDVLQSSSNLSVLLASQKPLKQADFDEAQELFTLAIKGKEITSGPTHPSTLYTVSQYAKLLSDDPSKVEKHLAMAETLHARAVDNLQTVLHRLHPLCLTAMHNQAVHWLSLDIKPDARQKQLEEVFKARVEKLGKQHPDTVLTEQVLRQHRRVLTGMSRTMTQTLETWAEISIQEFSTPNNSRDFTGMRRRLRSWGVHRLKQELISTGHVDRKAQCLTIGMQPFNIFARLAAGVQTQEGQENRQRGLKEFKGSFMIATNRPEADDKWNSRDQVWLGKASMSKRHVFLLVKDLHWEWFNILTFGLESGVQNGLDKLNRMKEAVKLWASAQPEWSSNIGMFFHVHAHTGTPSLHLHVLDMDALGPSYEQLDYKNLSIDEAIETLQEEVNTCAIYAKELLLQ